MVAKGYTTVSALRSRTIHAVSLRSPTRTMCDRAFSGWRVGVTESLNCSDCKLAIVKDTVGAKR